MADNRSMTMSGTIFWLGVASAFSVVSCGPQGLQRQDQFDWAIKSGAGSTSPPIVRIRLVDAKAGAGSIRCVYSDALVDAIIAENRLPYDEAGYEEAISIALASRSHSFRFVRPLAIKEITATHGTMEGGLSNGCKLIDQGKSALWADMQATVVEGPIFPLASGAR